MKIFFDTEFTGLHKDTTLISIGLIDEVGNKCYAEITDYDKTQVNDWIQKNVIDNLYVHKIISSGFTRPGRENETIIRGNKELVSLSLSMYLDQYNDIEFVSDVDHYDFVLLIDLLFGHALKMPEKYCADCYNINQDIARYYNITLKEAFNKNREEILEEHGIKVEGIKHNALYDAKVIKEIYNICSKK